MNIFMQKPSCIKELKRLANVITANDDTFLCMDKVKEIVNSEILLPTEKIIKLKEICKKHGE